MVMDMGREATQEQDVVELVYQPTVKDLDQALRARLRASRSGRMQRWLPGAMAVLALLMLALVIATGSGSPIVILWLLVAAVMVAAIPWFQARQLHRFAQRQGTCRTLVTDTGVSIANDAGTTTINWAGMPRYAEAAEVFVLLSGDNTAVGVAVLPKRGIQEPADADRLREILDRNLTRV
ncbi:YcxB family protein [Streptomyces sp. NBC_00299]|uniref:YcxB family protein n=1 Tax=Streptomyces sp. NBC_00299 TaxID=2975705 RepID=UPI002E28C579|nr:YcxB family protein [Streptomyces sp. NBC_00299]